MCSFKSVLILVAFFIQQLTATESDLPCAADIDCEIGGLYGECVENSCNYWVNVSPSLNVVATLEGRCNFDDECNIEKAQCVKHKCTCIEGYVASNNLKKCLPVNEYLGARCEESSQCAFENAECMRGKCICLPGFKQSLENNTVCERLNGVGAKCEYDADCEVLHTACSANRTCQCMDEFTTIRGACYRNTGNLFMPCNVTMQCTMLYGDSVECQKGTCACSEHYVFDKEKNVCLLPLNESIQNAGVALNYQGFLVLFGILVLKSA